MILMMILSFQEFAYKKDELLFNNRTGIKIKKFEK